MEIKRSPDTTGMDPYEAIMADMLVMQFTKSIDETIIRVKASYRDYRNDGFRTARLITEKTLFRLYELKYFVLPHLPDTDLLAFAFDETYRIISLAKAFASFDKDLAETEYNAALCHVKEKNYSEAGKHFFNAAINGHTAAQYNYGVSLANGELGEADPTEAAFWYYVAATKGNEKAIVNLAIAYRNGTGLYPDRSMMAYWYTKGAMIPFPYAVYNLGLILQYEEVLPGNSGIGRNLKEASEKLFDEGFRNYALLIASKVFDIVKQEALNSPDAD